MLKRTTFNPKAKIENAYLRLISHLMEEEHSQNLSTQSTQLLEDTENGKQLRS